MRSAEAEYYERQFDMVNKSKQKGKNWWKTVGHFIKGDKNFGENYLLEGDTVVSDAKSKAEVFNNFFCKQNIVDDTNFLLPTAQPVHGNTLNTINVSEDEVFSILASLDVTKATGPDGINPTLLKESASACFRLSSRNLTIDQSGMSYPAVGPCHRLYLHEM